MHSFFLVRVLLVVSALECAAALVSACSKAVELDRDSRGWGQGWGGMTRYLCLLTVVHTAIFAATAPALSKAPTAAMAKTCRERAINAFPRIGPGIYGNAAAQREYFRNCVSEMQREQKPSGQPSR